MSEAIRILHLEDLQSDSDLVLRELKKSGMNFQYHWVSSGKTFEKELDSFSPDIILCDHSLPGFNSTEALNILRRKDLDIPFILITATISEESVVDMVSNGINDYILKDRLSRLPTAVMNAIENAESQKENAEYLRRIINHEKRFRALIENMEEGIILLNQHYEFTFISKSVTRISGYTFEELRDRSIYVVLDPADIFRAKALLRLAATRREEAICTVFRIRHKNGEVRWVEGSVHDLLKDDDIHSVVINYRDITEKREQELLLRRSEANLKAIFNNTSISYVLLDRDLRVLSYNPTAEVTAKRVGWKLKEGETLLQNTTGDKNDLLKERLASVLKGKTLVYNTNFRTDEAALGWLKVQIAPVLDEKKASYGIIISAEDITERKMAEIEREKMTSDLIQHNKNLEQFAYIISHNLRSPVANILGISNLIHNSPKLSEEVFKRCMEGLEQSVKKLDEIIIDLNYILQVRREVNEQKEMVNLTALIKDLKMSIGNVIEKENITIITHFTEVKEIFTIKSYLTSIFFNLISNSIKYRHPSRPCVIEVSARSEGERVVLRFKDNGLGIDLKKHESRIFGLYKKFHPHIEGKGMGLYMVKTQVEILGGTISVESEPDLGTEFIILFNS